MPPPGSRSHTWGARASGLAGEREHYGLKKRPSRPSRFGQRAAQQPPLLLLLVLLSWLAPTCRAAITFSVSAGDTQYTERSAAKAIDPGFTIATDAADKISKAIVTLTAPEGPTLDVMEFQSLGGGLAVIDYIPETKTIELVGSSTADEYQNALRQMTFYNPSSTPEITDRKVAFRLFGLSGVEIVSSAKIKTVRIITVDDTPTLRLTSTSKEYREGDGKIVIDAGISLSDPDTEKLSFASVQISSGYVDGQDGLYLDVDVSAFDPDLSARWNSAAATYNVTGLANSSSYQAVLRSFKFANTDQALLPGNRTIAFTVADQTSTVTAEIVLVVKAVNQAPVLTLSKSSITFKESNLSPMVLDDLLTLTDPDSLDIVNCTITVSSNYVAGLDSLSIPDSTNWNTYITAAYTNETGVLTLAGRAPASIYQVQPAGRAGECSQGPAQPARPRGRPPSEAFLRVSAGGAANDFVHESGADHTGDPQGHVFGQRRGRVQQLGGSLGACPGGQRLADHATQRYRHGL